MNRQLLRMLCKLLLLTPITAMDPLEQIQPDSKSFTESFLTAYPNPTLEWDYSAKKSLEKEIKLQKKNDEAGRITLYHTQCWDGILLEELHRLLAPENRHHYLRGPQPLPEGVWDATTFIQRPDFLEGKGHNDTKSQNRPHILCVSLSLQDGASMESAAGFLNRPTGALGSNCDVNKTITFDSVVNDIIDFYANANEKIRPLTYDIKEKFLKISHRIMGLTSHDQYRMSRLYTFSVPFEHLNTVFYLSLPFGTDNISGDMVGIYRAMRVDYASGKSYMEQNAPSFERSPADNFSLSIFWTLFGKNPQGRLLVTHPLLQNPDVLIYKTKEVAGPEGKALYEIVLNGMRDIRAFIDLSGEVD